MVDRKKLKNHIRENIKTRAFINTIQDFCTYHNNFKETYVLAQQSLEIFFLAKFTTLI